MSKMYLIATRGPQAAVGCCCGDCHKAPSVHSLGPSLVAVEFEDLGERLRGWHTSCFHWRDKYAWSAVRSGDEARCENRTAHDNAVLLAHGLDIDGAGPVPEAEVRTRFSLDEMPQ